MMWEYLTDPAHGVVRETRPQQIALAKYLSHAVSTDTPVLAEAPTGVGKSFAYLLAAIEAARTGKRVVISTAMKSLQQQLYFKDLPYLSTKMKTPNFARVLGKKNYACQRRVAGNVFDKKELAVYEEFFNTVFQWVWDDAPTELSEQLPRNKHEWSVGYCSGERCAFYETCSERGYQHAYQQARDANIIVINHALYGADIRVQTQFDKKLLGNFDVVIVDEAHKFPEAIRNALSCDMPAKFFYKAQDAFDQLQSDMDSDFANFAIGDVIEKLPKTLPLHAELTSAYNAMFRETTRTQSFGQDASIFAARCAEACKVLEKTLGVGTLEFRQYLAGADTHGSSLSPKLQESTSAMALLHYLDSYSDRLASFANAITHATRDRLHFTVGLETSGDTTTIKTIPIDIARDLREHSIVRNAYPIYLSATLCVNGSFEHFANEVGFELAQMPPYVPDEEEDDGRIIPKPRPAPNLIVSSPFNYERNSWCYVPEGLPDPSQPGYIEAVIDESYDLLMANEGHAFILFTSYKEMNAVWHGLRAKGYPYRMLVQNDQLKARARELFLSTPHATLLGTRSFWEGIDIPGLHLSLVIIPKIPFPHPDDAVFRAKKLIAGDNWFGRVSKPAMITDIRQMAGRLIRTTTDKGVVALLDSRVHTKNYGGEIIKAIGMPMGTKKSTVLKLLGQITTKRKAIPC